MKKLKNILGLRFQKLVVIEELPAVLHANNKRSRYVRCLCDCGGEKISSFSNLQSGYSYSCGCASPRHGGYKTKLYGVWHRIVQCCTDKNYQAYANYGGRGIRLCEDWRMFKTFRSWAIDSGYAEGLSIERIDNNGDYCPENCKWIPLSDQAKNKRNTVWVEHEGVKLTAKDYSRTTGVPYSTVLYRIKSGAL